MSENTDTVDTFPETAESKRLGIPNTVAFIPDPTRPQPTSTITPPPKKPAVFRLLSIFGDGKKDDPTIVHLREVLAEIEKSMAWLRTLLERADPITLEAQRALALVAADPTPANAEAAFKAMVASRDSHVYKQIVLAINSGGMLWHRKVERLDPACRAALLVMIEKLEREQATLRQQHEAESARYGVSADHRANPALNRVEEALQEAKALLSQLPFGAARHQQYMQVVNFILGPESERNK